MRPEQKVAVRLREIHNLTAPINVQALVEHYADVVYVPELPEAIDGLKIPCEKRVDTSTRPLILVRSDRPEGRRRFTLAHELAHLVIPWHVEAGVTYTAGRDNWQEDCESEADRFAAELLAPAEWVLGLWVQNDPNLNSFWDAVSLAGLSTMATVLAVSKALPTGFVFYKIDHQNRVLYSARSPSAHLPLPQVGSIVTPDTWNSAALGAQCRELAHRLFCVTHCGPSAVTFDSENAQVTAKDVLEEMLLDKADLLQARTRASVNGIIGAANSGSKKPQTREQLVGALHQRFLLRPELSPLISHPKFRLFLSLKAKELRP